MVVVLLLTGFVVVLLRSSTPGCTVSVGRPVLPAALAALGDFQQPYPAGDISTLEDVAARAASADDPALYGSVPQQPVTVTGAGDHPSALVVPLRSTAADTSKVVALAVFEEDCAGNAFFESLEDDAIAPQPLLDFPPVTRATAAAKLGSPSLTLEWSSSPLQPFWVTAISPPASLAAR